MIAGAAPKAGERQCWSKASSLQHPAEGLGRMSPPLSAPSVTVVIPVMNEAKDLPRLFDRTTHGLRVLGVVFSERFRCIGALPIDIRPRYVVPPARALPSDVIHVRPTHSDPLAIRSHVAVESPAMRPRAPLDLIHSTSNAARVTTRARESLS